MNIRFFIYTIIILSLPFQFSFQLNFYGTAQYKIEEGWDFSKISSNQIEISNKITTYAAAIFAIVSIFVSYKIQKRRLPICIMFIVNAIVFIFYLMINDNNFVLVLILKFFNGVLLGFFQSVHISYLMHFVDEEYIAFNGCLVQFSMFLSLILVEILTYLIHWKMICVIIIVQSFLFAGLIWIVPEVPIVPKKKSGLYIWKKPYLKNCLVMMTIMLLQGFSGIGFMIDNCARLMSAVGINIHSTLQSALTNFIGFLAVLISAFIMDIIGVRNLWAFSTFGLVISLVLYAITLKMETPKWLGVFSVFLYFLFYGLGSGPIPWLLCGVIFPENLMIETGGINCFMNRFLDIWFGTYVVGNITKSFGEFGSILFNVCASILAAFFGLFFIPKFKNGNAENASLL